MRGYQYIIVAHYVITEQSDCSIGVQYIESYSTFLQLYKFYIELPKAVFLFPNQNGVSKVQQMQQIRYLIHTRATYITLVCVFLHSAAPRAKPQTRAIIWAHIALLCIQYPILVVCVSVCDGCGRGSNEFAGRVQNYRVRSSCHRNFLEM